MDEYKSQSWLVMADYGCGLWDDRGYGTAADDDEINAPHEYVNRFNAWLDKYWDNDNLEGVFDLDSFNAEGRALAVELKKIVGLDIKVMYRHEVPHPSGDKEYLPEETEEIT
ncbi:MAG: hypothetical protein LBP33_12270 [Candidatus Adiutrix sp.]|jgi:hypothetical protein|nr:hypothetical protein [Candidatus Adiutrix sp.]